MTHIRQLTVIQLVVVPATLFLSNFTLSTTVVLAQRYFLGPSYKRMIIMIYIIRNVKEAQVLKSSVPYKKHLRPRSLAGLRQ